MDLFHAYVIPVVDGVAYGLLLFTVAAGLTLAFGVANVLNLAHGTVYAAGAYVAVAVTDGSWVGLGLAVLAGAAIGAAAGGLLTAAVAPLAGRGHLAQALLTFGVALIGGTLLVRFFGSEEQRPQLPPALKETVNLFGHNYSGYRLAFIGFAAILALAGWLVVTRTKVGARVRATVDDRGMVACTGTDPRMVLTGVMVAAGILAGAAGALGAEIIGPGPSTHNNVLLLSMVIIVIGGMGSVGGAFLAALAVGQVQSLGVVLEPRLAPYLLFGSMLIALLLRRPSWHVAGAA